MRLNETMENMLERFEKRSRMDFTPFSSGFDEIDMILNGGYEPGQLHILAAQPGSGKTSFACNIALHNAINNKPVIFITAELSPEDLFARMANIYFQDHNKTWSKLRSGRDLESIKEILEIIKGKPLRILPCSSNMDDNWFITLSEHIKDSTGKVPIIIIDYLQPFASKVYGANTDEKRSVVDKASAGLLKCANDTGACMLVISSTSRNNYGNLSNNPKMNVLAMGKESGQIEFDAATVSALLKNSNSVDEFNIHHTYCDYCVGKHRFFFSSEIVNLDFVGAIGKFDVLSVTNGAVDESEEVLRAIMEDNEYSTLGEISDAVLERRPDMKLNNTKLSNMLKKIGYTKIAGDKIWRKR